MSASGQAQPMQNPTTVTRPSSSDLVVTRAFDAPVQAVFDAWTRPELFRQWWAPRSMGATLAACEIDARTGGGYRIAFAGADGAEPMVFFGRYLEATAPWRLIWTNEESNGGPVTTVTFEDRGGRTRLTFAEHYAGAEPPPEAAAGMEAMMAEQFAQLDHLLAAGRRP